MAEDLVDAATWMAETLKQLALEAISERGLDPPAQAMVTTGAGIPLQDCCEGLLWVRVDTMYPTDGTGQPLTQARVDWDIPAFTVPLHLGFMMCHATIDPEGYTVDPEAESGYAHRDGAYRAALYVALVEKFPKAVQPYASGYRLDPWVPLGPQGGCTGGHLLTNVVTNWLLIPASA